MGFAGNFHSEWGYLAPAPSFMRTARIVLVATTVGATAGAGMVFSLVDRPATAGGETSVAARTLARPVEAASTPLSTPQAAQVSAQAAIQNQSTKPSATNGHEGVIAPSESSTSSTAQAPASIATLAEVPADAAPAKAADVTMPTAGAAPATDPAPVQKKATKKPHFASRYASRGGPLAFVRGEYYNRVLGDGRWGYYYQDKVYSDR
jgi:hypothetical protein